MLRRKEVGVAGLREVGRGSRVGKVGRSSRAAGAEPTGLELLLCNKR